MFSKIREANVTRKEELKKEVANHTYKSAEPIRGID
jgi:hypothetical protein